jgi:hypothetical protein
MSRSKMDKRYLQLQLKEHIARLRKPHTLKLVDTHSIFRKNTIGSPAAEHPMSQVTSKEFCGPRLIEYVGITRTYQMVLHANIEDSFPKTWDEAAERGSVNSMSVATSSLGTITRTLGHPCVRRPPVRCYKLCISTGIKLEL